MVRPSPLEPPSMPVVLEVHESQLFRNVPEGDLVDLAVELDLPVPERIERDALVGAAIEGIAQLARREGLPFSAYDQDDLAALPPDHLQALAELVGAQPSVSGILKSGRKVYKAYRKTRPNSQVALMLPMLLKPLARYASQVG